MKFSKHGLLLAITSALMACGSQSTPTAISPGSVIVSRPVPQTSVAANDTISPLGFLPLKESDVQKKSFISIDKNSNELSFADKKVPFINNELDLTGTLSIVHKQKQPVWYANDHYFEARKLAVPAEGHADRFLRGVLGEQALFLDKETAVYSTKLGNLSPAKGLQVSESDLAFLFDTIAVGTEIKVK